MGHLTGGEKQRVLSDATNLLCDFVSRNLPRGWEIVLTMRRGGCEIELFDPSADLVDTATPEIGISLIDSLCMQAAEREQAESR